MRTSRGRKAQIRNMYIAMVLGILIIPACLLAAPATFALKGNPSSSHERGGAYYDFEYNTSGILDHPYESWAGDDYIVATIENDTGYWLRLRELSFPLGIDTRVVPEWLIFLDTGIAGPPQGPPASADFTGPFVAGEDPKEYTDVDLLPHSILVAPGHFFTVGFEGSYSAFDLLCGQIDKVPGASTYYWHSDNWHSYEDEGKTVLIQVFADYHDMSQLTVNPDGSGDFPTIQDAIDAVDPDGTVLLGDGVFYGPGNHNLDFGGKDLTLSSISNDPELCIIDCDDPGAFFSRGFDFSSGETSSSLVQGLTVRNGFIEYAPGIWIMDSSPTIQNCIFENGICMIGGAICINGGSPKIIDCVFGGNVAEFVGGAIVSEKANAVIRNCRFESNFAEYYGGALYISKGFGTLVENCVFYNNIAVGGGGIYINGDLSTRVTSCSFVENTSTVGSGIYLEGENLVVWLSLFAFGEGQALYCEPFGRVPVDIACCDIFGNKGGDWVDCIADEYGIAGNISLDPEFCGEIGTGNLTLQSDSPCRAEGNTCAYLIGAEPVNCEETSTQLTTWSRLKQLY